MANPAAAVKTGTIPFVYQGETFHTFYAVYGDLANRTKDPLIVLHGGPGFIYNSLVPFSDLAVDAATPVILYDQLGNGQSTHLRDKPAEFWTIDLFLDELANLIAFFGIEGAFDLAGHSWGGILASEFEVRRQPAGLKHIVLVSSLASFALWEASNVQLMQAFPADVQAALRAGPGSKAYVPALLQLHKKHACTLPEFPKEFMQTIDAVFGKDGDMTVASNLPRLLGGWTIIDRLDKVRVPTFVINGRDDLAQDFVVAPFFHRIPKVKWVTLENASHLSFWEVRGAFMKLVADFLAL